MPGHAECGVGAGDFDHPVGSAVRGDTSHGIEAFIGRYYRYAGILVRATNCRRRSSSSHTMTCRGCASITHCVCTVRWGRLRLSAQCRRGIFPIFWPPRTLWRVCRQPAEPPVGHVVGDYGQAVVGMPALSRIRSARRRCGIRAPILRRAMCSC